MAVQFELISKLQNGANFFTGDLHIHTFGASPCVSDTSMTVENIVENAYARKISIIGITDHNTTKNVEAAIAYGQKYTGSLLVIPGVEITTSNGHLLVYFPPENVDHLNKLLAIINIVYPNTQESHTIKSMSDVIIEAERLGGISIAAHIDRAKSGFETLTTGYPNWKKDIITSSGLLGLEFDNQEYLNWYTNEDDATGLGGERKKLLDLRRNSDQKHIRLSLAHTQSSDAHSISEFITNIDKDHLSRFKMDELSFAGFKTALIDPDARVRVLNKIPKSFPKILGMHISGGFLDNCAIRFSNNLNCFIGGRGAGKSTAIQSLAYGLDKTDKISSTDNCPHTITIYAQDKNDVMYKYERHKGGNCLVQAYIKQDRTLNEVPSDSFKIEFYGQNDLSEVSRDPLKNVITLQNFLDEHIDLHELLLKEKSLVAEINQLNTQIKPLEMSKSGKASKQAALDETNKKLVIAENGKIKEIASIKTQLGAERSFTSEISKISNGYSAGLSLRNFLRNYDSLVQQCGSLTNNQKSNENLQKIKQYIQQANQILNAKQNELNTELKKISSMIDGCLSDISGVQRAIEIKLSDKITELQKQGLTGNVEELESLITIKSRLISEVTKIENESDELSRLISSKNELLTNLKEIRGKIIDARETQGATINKSLSKVIDDYLVFLHYDKSGIIDDFKYFLLKVMQGEHFQEDAATRFATETTPEEFFKLLWNNDKQGIAKIAGVGIQWAERIFNKFWTYEYLYELETMWKAPKPVITVKLKTTPPKEIPVNQLSDGQKHTILLTIAMLSDSSNPLIIDQPEDDLDNAYIFSSLVSNLRQVKEQRQIILVTHNANIAVLGDAEQIFPLFRNGDTGQIKDSGSIDNRITKNAVQNILEGGEIAFKKRMDMYGY